MQTILVPTDFSAASLKAIPAICQQYPGDELTFIFVHMFKLSDSIGDLLMLSRRSREYEHIDDSFYTDCRNLKDQYPQISTMRIEFLYGHTLSLFRNFIENNDVTLVVDTEHNPVGKLNKNSIDLSILVKRSGLPIVNAARIKPAVTKKATVAVQEDVLAELSV